jgi:small subunit ribosomal protein S1
MMTSSPRWSGSWPPPRGHRSLVIGVTGRVKAKVKGGLIVNIGVEAFLPASQIDVISRRRTSTSTWATYEFKVVKINQERQNIVLSRRELIEQERTTSAASCWAKSSPATSARARSRTSPISARSSTSNGMDGLLHITDMSWGRIGHPSEMLKVGQEIDVVVLDVNKEKERVSLGLKQKMANPWDNIETSSPSAPRSRARSSTSCPTARSCELEPGVEGLVHVTELSWTKRIAKPSDVLKQARKSKRSCSASTARSRRSPSASASWSPIRGTMAAAKYPSAPSVKGKVRNLTSYGAFVELEEGIDGMVHVSDMSWTRKINHPSEVLKKGDEVEAIVLEVDRPNQRIALGMKQLATDPWPDIDSSTSRRLVTGKVTKLASFGAFVGAASTASTASSTSRRSARSAWTRSRTCSSPARKSPPASSRSTGRAPHRPVHQGRQLQRRAAPASRLSRTRPSSAGRFRFLSRRLS